jgi:hypothetical protein
MKQVILGLGLVLVLGGSAQASDPTGIYARIDKVVLEPNDEKPERIQIWGTLALAKVRSGGDEYDKPVKGYLYYALVPGKEDQCRKEWADLKKVAGKDQCVAFGSRYAKLGTVRKADQKPRDADPYVLARGVVKVDAANPQAQALKEKVKP